MILKISRHAKILELIDTYDIETQDELAKKLQEAGFSVTQATVSRDIREMRLTSGLCRWTIIYLGTASPPCSSDQPEA